MSRRLQSEAGFTLPELLIATGIMVVVTGAIFAQLNPASGSFKAQPEVADLQQRMRVGEDTLKKDLIMAGSGVYSGAQSGSLVGYFAPLMPYRQGANPALDDGPGVFKTDSISMIYVPTTSSQTSIAMQMPNTSADLKVTSTSDPGCPTDPNTGQPDASCGFGVGESVLIFDDTGSFDTFTITQVQTNMGQGQLGLQHRQQGPLSKAYGPGARIAAVKTNVYFYNAPTNQLMFYDGSATSSGVPVLDNVVGVNFEYYGEPMAPQLRHPGTDETTTYGPKPPALGVVQGNWPAGENCTFQVVGGAQQPRLATLGNANGGLVQLAAPQLTDGPWCPDSLNTNRFDADLLRIRKVRVTLRLQAADMAVRGGNDGTASTPFINAGTSKGGYGYVPDQIIRFDVSPRNLNLNR